VGRVRISRGGGDGQFGGGGGGGGGGGPPAGAGAGFFDEDGWSNDGRGSLSGPPAVQGFALVPSSPPSSSSSSSASKRVVVVAAERGEVAGRRSRGVAPASAIGTVLWATGSGEVR
jgi:hypothetical protein